MKQTIFIKGDLPEILEELDKRLNEGYDVLSSRVASVKKWNDDEGYFRRCNEFAAVLVKEVCDCGRRN